MAGPASRALAWLVDSIMLTGLLTLSLMFFSLFGMTLVLLAGFLIVHSYFIYFEVAGNGQTPGKRAFGLRAMRQDGRSLTLRDSLLRNLLRTVDWMPLGYGLGVVAMLAGSRRQRLGDLVAGTVVVREQAVAAAIPEARYQLAEATLLRERDLQWIRLYQQWSGLLLPLVRRRTARRLAQALADRMGVEPPEERSSEGFLADLADSRDSGASSRSA